MVAVLLVNAATENDKDESTTHPYEKAQFLTPAERSFFGVLVLAVGDEVTVFAKVRVADVVTPKPGMAASDRTTALNRVTSKHFDFVLCDKAECNPICVIELDDKSHRRALSQKADALKDGACKAANIPLVRVRVRQRYTVEELREQFGGYVLQGQVRAAGQVDAPRPGKKTCPQCGAEMKQRKARQGKHAGQPFWGCSQYPSCKYIENTEA